ncbi:MAG: hypothetical protein ACKVS9_08925 [Phycisphaerae bacterium]
MSGKVLFVGALLAALGGIMSYVLTGKMNGEPPEMLPIGFVIVSGEVTQIDIAVGMFDYKKDPPKLKQSVDDWIKNKFQLKDDSGAAVTLRRSNFSKGIPDAVSGTAEFYLHGQLKPGKSYTLEYVPIVEEGVRHRHTFAAPASAVDAERVTLTLVEG